MKLGFSEVSVNGKEVKERWIVGRVITTSKPGIKYQVLPTGQFVNVGDAREPKRERRARANQREHHRENRIKHLKSIGRIVAI